MNPSVRMAALLLAMWMAAWSPIETLAATAKPAPSVAFSAPDITGPGTVLREGNVRMKVTNFGNLGNPFSNLSADPSAMWPDSSGIEYLNHISLAVAAKDPSAPPGVPAHRVSYSTEWSPISAGPEDRLYRTWQTALHGARFVNDDGDIDPVTGTARVDEDFLDGRDDDGDGLIDEDFGGLGYEGYTCLMRDDGAYRTPVGASPDPPLALECRQTAWNYKVVSYEDFVAMQFQIVNRSGHTLDSMFVGFQVDMDLGPASSASFFLDDRDLPGYPSGAFTRLTSPPQRQLPHSPSIPGPDSALCPRVPLVVRGFSVADNDGDAGQTPGLATFLLIDHTIDPLGFSAPAHVGFRSFRSFTAGTPFSMGGNPSTDSLRYLFMSSSENVDPATGFVTQAPGAAAGDYLQWCSIGPFRNVPDGAPIEVTIAFQVTSGTLATAQDYPADYAAFGSGSLPYTTFVAKHRPLDDALRTQILADGVYELLADPLVTDFHGRETPLRLPPGSPPVMVREDCSAVGREPRNVIVTDHDYSWFDFDCDYCTGPWDYPSGRGLVRNNWKMNPGLLAVDERARARPGGLRIVTAGPNPSAGRSAVTFELPRAARSRVEILDPAGRRVRRIADRAYPAGRVVEAWDGFDAGGRRVPPGVYLWRISSGSETAASVFVRLE